MKRIIRSIFDYIKNNKLKVTLAILFLISFSIPIIRLGIMHNDELMSRFWSSQGFTKFYGHYFVEQLQKGRALSCIIIPFTMYLGFIGQNTFSFKTIQIISIVMCAILFGILLNKILKDKKFSILYVLLFLVFLPISFEPTVPNVFVTFYNVSICFLIISFMLFIDYLDTNNRKKLYISMLVFFLVELSYEAFITYVPIYLLLIVYKKGLKNIFKDKRALFWPIFCGLLYLCLYIISTKIFPSNYSGNQIDNINIINSLKIVFNLGKYTFPGSYLLSDKYQWLFKYYYKKNYFDLIRIILISIIFVIIAFKNLKTEKDNNLNIVSVLKIIFIGGWAIVLPILPISVASMYQTMDIGGNTLGLPVSFFSYFGSALILCVLATYIAQKIKFGKFIVIFTLTIIVIEVQSMNSVFSTEAYRDFTRLQKIESFITSGIFNNLNNENIYAPDLFITKNALAIHDNHWNDFAKYNGVNNNFINNIGNEMDYKLYFLENFSTFELIHDNNIYLISNQEIDKIWLFDNSYIEFENKYYEINNWKVYYFNLDKEKMNQCLDINNEENVLNACSAS